MTDCDCYATATDSSRADMWKRIFPPDGKVPIVSPLPKGMGSFPDGEGWKGRVKAEFYLVDFDRVTPEQKQRLIQEISRKFNQPESEVIKDIERQGAPIKGTDVMVSWCHRHMMAIR